MSPRVRQVRAAGGMLAAFCTAGCGPPDYESFADYTDKLNQRFEETQDCHSLLEMPASMMNGRAYRAAPVEFGAGGRGAYWGRNWVSEQGLSVRLTAYNGASYMAPPCSDELYSYLVDRRTDTNDPGTLWFLVNTIRVADGTLPGFGWIVANDRSITDTYGPFTALQVSLGGPATGQHAWSGFYGGAWVCTESYTGPVGTHQGPPDWIGVMFIHAELWELPDGSVRNGGTPLSRRYGSVTLPLDVIVRLEDVGCEASEDAADRDQLPYYCYNWTADCDGIDNDLDGEIDEGVTVDLNHNGVADCMDDWDHDGIPNVEDPDVHDYGCGGY